MTKRRPKLTFSKTIKTSKHVQSPFPVQIAQGTAVLFCSSSSLVSDNLHVVLLSAVAMKCTVYRTVFLKKEIDVDGAKKLLKRWAKVLPLEQLKIGQIFKEI